jgi:hypothetical protein
MRYRVATVRLRVPRDAVLDAIRRGDLHATRFGNRHGYRIRRVDYATWLATPATKAETPRWCGWARARGGAGRRGAAQGGAGRRWTLTERVYDNPREAASLNGRRLPARGARQW